MRLDFNNSSYSGQILNITQHQPCESFHPLLRSSSAVFLPLLLPSSPRKSQPNDLRTTTHDPLSSLSWFEMALQWIDSYYVRFWFPIIFCILLNRFILCTTLISNQTIECLECLPLLAESLGLMTRLIDPRWNETDLGDES